MTAVNKLEIKEKQQINMLEIMDSMNLKEELTVTSTTPTNEISKMKSLKNSKMKWEKREISHFAWKTLRKLS